MKQRLLLGEAVKFGAIVATHEGLEVKGTVLPWDGLQISFPRLKLPEKAELLKGKAHDIHSQIMVLGKDTRGVDKEWLFYESRIPNARALGGLSIEMSDK